MSTDEYVPSDEDIEEFYAIGRVEYSPGSAITLSSARDEFRRGLTRIRHDAVEEYKDRQVQIHISPAPAQMVPVRAHCPRCGH